MKDLKELVANKNQLIDLKKASIKTVKGGLSFMPVPNKATFKGAYKNGDTNIQRTIVGNTYLWMDSHEDVHAKNLFKKSVSERKGNIFHLHDHEFKITSKVGEPIDIYEKEISWRELNVDKDGSTQALFMDSEIKKEYNTLIFNEYKNNKISQHSVGMQYVKIDLAVNDEEFEDEYKVWKENINVIGNKELAEEKGFFWFVREAKLIEISAVLMGSNELTPTLQDNKTEPSKDTQKEAAEESLQEQKRKYYMNKI